MGDVGIATHGEEMKNAPVVSEPRRGFAASGVAVPLSRKGLAGARRARYTGSICGASRKNTVACTIGALEL